MRATKIAPTGVERTFSDDDLIVSKTDPRGVITYANAALLKISAYQEDELLGQPHNVLRHPDMPRAVFKYMWETVSSGNEFFGYIMNLAADGAHYWVYAHITPSYGTDGTIVGYHSNRRSPYRPALESITPIYARLREAEQQAGGAAGLEASTALLHHMIAEYGRPYEELIWSITTKKAA